MQQVTYIDGSEPAVRAPSPDKDGVIDLGALLGTLFRGAGTIFVCAALAVVLGAYYAYFVAVPQFRSTAVVILETQREQVVNLDSVVGGLTGDASVLTSEVEVLRSRSLLEKVVTSLDLEADPEFNASLRPPSTFDGVKEAVKSIFGVSGGAVSVSEETQEMRKRDAVVSALLNRIEVRNLPNSLVFQVTATTTHPEKSALIADALVAHYIRNQLEVKFEATEQATSWLSERVVELKTELEAAEAQVKAFNSSTDLISSDNLTALDRQVKDLRDRIETVRLSLAADKDKRAALDTVTAREDIAAIANDTQLTRYLPRVDEVTIATAFDARLAQVITRLEFEIERGEAQIAALERSQSDLETQIAQQGQDLITLRQYEREAEASRVLYEHFLSRLKETSAQQGVQHADSRILSNATIPLAAAEPRKALILAAMALLGAMIGAAWVLWRAAGFNTFRTARDLEAHTGHIVLGRIPLLPNRQRRRLFTQLAKRPNSAVSEAVRDLRTSLMMTEERPKVVAVTSPLPGEGKSTMTLAIAQNTGIAGSKVLVIEGDTRRRVLAKYVRGRPRNGLFSVLEGDKTIAEAAAKVDKIEADVLLAERNADNTMDLFSSDAFQALLDEAREIYDFILIDTPPVLIVPDARVIAQHSDAVLMVVKWDTTTRSQLDEALHMFRIVKQKVTGLVLVAVDPRGTRKYGLHGSDGAHWSYGSKYYHN